MSVLTQFNRPTSSRRYLTTSRALAKIPFLSALLQAEVDYCSWALPSSKKAEAVLAWGRKPSVGKAEKLAKNLGLPILRLEDGFLRSVELGLNSPPWSVVIDDLGIYYDASAPSRLEHLIRQTLTALQNARAQQLIQQWCLSRVSKYNCSREHQIPDEPFILVVDQTFGDASIAHGLASANSFQQMLAAALAYSDSVKVVVKTHPDVFAGKKKGHFTPEQLQHPRIELLAIDIHVPSLLEKAQAVFCVTSQIGFEALLWQKPVFVFGMPFYAGWGLTIDALPAPNRRQPVNLLQLVHASLVNYPQYVHPETGQLCEVETLLNWLALQRRQRQRLPAKMVTVKIPRLKRAALKHFTQGSQLKWANSHAELQPGDWLLQWGADTDWPDTIRIEDGFIRSVGLGADLIKPSSWVFDRVGIYYDATKPSELEQLLQEATFSNAEQQRAEAIRQLLLQHQVTKYNLGGANWQRPQAERVILVPGQVETDASVRLGSPVLKTNLQLLQAVREAAPNAYIVYKPHPDVLAGLRKAGQADTQPSALYDELVTDQDIAYLFEQVDEIHTLTSLAGFEALLRGKKVFCYGQPFYAGWGLTTDRYPHPRRTRRRKLQELIAAVLIRYPTYISRETGYYTTPENVIKELHSLRQKQTNKQPWWRKLFRKVIVINRFIFNSRF